MTDKQSWTILIAVAWLCVGTGLWGIWYWRRSGRRR